MYAFKQKTHFINISLLVLAILVKLLPTNVYEIEQLNRIRFTFNVHTSNFSNPPGSTN